MLRRQFRKADAAEMWADVLLDRRLTADEGPWPDARTRHVLQPARQELRDGLPFVRNECALLRGSKRVLERIRDSTASAARRQLLSPVVRQI